MPEETQEVQVEQVEVYRGYFGVRAGMSAGLLRGEVVPVGLLGAEVGVRLGRQQSHLVYADMEIVLAERYLTQRGSLGYGLQLGALTLGPRLWVAELRAPDEVLVEAAPGASLEGRLQLPLGSQEQWWLVAGAEAGRGLGGWGQVSGLPVSHWRAELGLRSSMGMGMSVGAQQVGELQVGLLTFGVGF